MASVPALDASSKLAVVSHSVAALACTLERTHSQQLNSRLASDCSRWLSHLFRYARQMNYIGIALVDFFAQLLICFNL